MYEPLTIINDKVINKFYKDFESLDMDKAVSTMTKALGYKSSGTITDILNRKKKPGLIFINKFYRVFGEKLNKGVEDNLDYKNLYDELLDKLTGKLSNSARESELLLSVKAKVSESLEEIQKLAVQVKKQSLVLDKLSEQVVSPVRNYNKVSDHKIRKDDDKHS